MIIPAFSLPSNPTKNIQLREATVADAIDFADTDEGHNEEVTTLFLNRVQHKELYFDAKLWTAEDRNFALYWYWMHTTKEPEVPLTYDCSFCGKSHTWLLDMRLLAENYQAIEGKPERDIEFNEHKITVKPLSGADMEELELEGLGLEAIAESQGAQSKEYRKTAAKLKLDRFLRLLTFKEGDAEKIIMETSASDFEDLVSKVSEALEAMKHGLSDLRYDDAGAYFLTPPHKCPEPEKEGETRLRVPFRAQDYIPGL